MDIKKKVAVVIAVAIVAVALVLYFSQKNVGGPSGAAPAEQINPTRTSAPAGLVVPGEGDKNVPAGVAVPQSVSAGSPTDPSVSHRSFLIRAAGNQFSPNTVIVKIGDTVNISLTAVDKNYDFTQPDYGFKASIPKGKTGRIDFAATVSGKFIFYCASCGGPAKGPVGYIVIAP